MTVNYKTPQGWVTLAGMKPIEIKQDTGGITIDGKVLQDASATQDGLMTKEMVARIVALENIPNANGRSY